MTVNFVVGKREGRVSTQQFWKKIVCPHHAASASMATSVMTAQVMRRAQATIVTNVATAKQECANASQDGLAMLANNKPFALFLEIKNVQGMESALSVSVNVKRDGPVQAAQLPKAALTTAQVQTTAAVLELTAHACLGGQELTVRSRPR